MGNAREVLGARSFPAKKPRRYWRDKEFRRLLQPRIVFRLVPRDQAGWAAECHIRTHWLLQWQLRASKRIRSLQRSREQTHLHRLLQQRRPVWFRLHQGPCSLPPLPPLTLRSRGRVDPERDKLTDGEHQTGCRLRIFPLKSQSCCFQEVCFSRS